MATPPFTLKMFLVTERSFFYTTLIQFSPLFLVYLSVTTNQQCYHRMQETTWSLFLLFITKSDMISHVGYNCHKRWSVQVIKIKYLLTRNNNYLLSNILQLQKINIVHRTQNVQQIMIRFILCHLGPFLLARSLIEKILR